MNMVSTATAIAPSSQTANIAHGPAYLAEAASTLESALARAHEGGHENAVRILHAVIAILETPSR